MRLQLNLLLTLLIAASFSASSLAAAKNKKTRGLPDANPANVEIDDKPVQDAKSKLAIAQGKAEHAQDAMNTLLAELRKQAEASPAVAQAVTALKQAQSDYDSGANPILTRVRGTSEYQTALDEKKAASQRVLALQAEIPPNQEEITKAAMVVLNKGHAITQLETENLAADPKIAALKEKLAAANTQLLKARYAAEQSVKNDPQIQAGKKTIDQAQAEIPPLQSAYDSALQQYNTAVAARDATMNNNNNSNASDGNNTGNKGKAKYKKKMAKRKVRVR
jgi:hypothetical protein